MTVELWIETAPFGCRVARVEGGRIVRLLHHFPDRNEAVVGDVHLARVIGYDKRLGAVQLDLGEAPGFLRRKGKLPPVGSDILVEVRRGALGDKSADVNDAPVLRLPTVNLLPDGTVREGVLGGDGPAKDVGNDWATDGPPRGRRTPAPVPVVLATRLASRDLDRIKVSSAEDLRALAPWFPDGLALEIDPGLGAAITDAEDRALQTKIALPGGGIAIIEETAALFTVDVDLAKQGGQSQRGAAQNLLGSALEAIAAHLRLMNAGGQIVIDLPRGAIASPKIARDQVTRAMKPLGRVSIPAVTPEGLVIVIAPRPDPSIRERLLETVGDAPFQSVRFKPESAAWRAYGAAAAALGRQRTARVTLTVSDRVGQWFGPDSPSIADLRARFGDRIVVETGTVAGDFDVAA